MGKRGKIEDLSTWPHNGDVYFWVRSDIGDICMSEWADGVKKHEFKRSIGNIFRTRSDAQAAIARQQARAMDRSVANG